MGDPKVVSLGDLNVDLIVKVDHLPSRGGSALAQIFELVAGGTAGNFAVGVSRLGVSCGLITKIGSDEFGHFLLNDLKKEGVDVSHVVIGEGLSSNKLILIINEENVTTGIASIGSATKFFLTPSDIDEEYIIQAKLLGTSGISLLFPSMGEVTLRAMEITKRNNVITSFDPNLRLVEHGLPKELFETFKKAIELTDIFLPNDKEIRYLTQENELNEAANTALKWGPKIIALKRGALGCRVITEESEEDYQAFPVNVVDITGAGDSFDAAFIVGYLQGWSLDKIARFANAAGALCVTKVGARTGFPYRNEIEAFLNHHKN